MTGQDGSADAAPLEFRVLSGGPSADELAAVTAVLSAMIEEAESVSRQGLATGQSAWQRSQRPIRTPLSPGYGAWRSFSA